MEKFQFDSTVIEINNLNNKINRDKRVNSEKPIMSKNSFHDGNQSDASSGGSHNPQLKERNEEETKNM